MSETSIVELQGVAVGYNRHAVLAGVDLQIARGTFAGLLGANGSGKTTLLKTIAGILPPVAGTVTFHPPAVLGYVPQRDQLDSVFLFSAFEVALMGVCGRIGAARHIGSTERERVHDCLRQTGADGFARERFAELSGGQKQRVLIARALVRDPALLVLDEPVAGVDLPSQEAFATTLTDLTARGRTVLVVLHELGALAPLVQRAVVLRHGAVVHDGAPPTPTAEHGRPGHDHVHPHDPGEQFSDSGAGLRWEP